MCGNVTKLAGPDGYGNQNASKAKQKPDILNLSTQPRSKYMEDSIVSPLKSHSRSIAANACFYDQQNDNQDVVQVKNTESDLNIETEVLKCKNRQQENNEESVTTTFHLSSAVVFEDITWESSPKPSSSDGESFVVGNVGCSPFEESVVGHENAPKTWHVSDNAKVPKRRTSTTMTEMVDGSIEWTLEHYDSKVWQIPVENGKVEKDDFKNHSTGCCQKRWIVIVIVLFVVVSTSIIVSMTVLRWRQTLQYFVTSCTSSSQEETRPISPNDLSTNVSDNASMHPSNEDAKLTQPPTTTALPVSTPTISPVKIPVQVVSFGAVADAPNSQKQRERLFDQLLDLDGSLDFLVHVGDIRTAEEQNGERPECMLEDYKSAAQILRRSPVPVFIVIGDNDWYDCPNTEEGLEFWHQTFLGFESRYWNHSFDIMRQPDQPDNFAFIHKHVLFIGVNTIGGSPNGEEEEREWKTLFSNELTWTKQVIRDYDWNIGNKFTGRVVLFGHVDPGEFHLRWFFNPLTEFMQTEFQNQIPMLLVNGHRHEWSYDLNFLGQPNFLRITLTGDAIEAPVTVRVISNGDALPPSMSFKYERHEKFDSFDG